MSMSTHVVGFKPPDDKWKKMKAAYDACRAAGTDPPDDVEKYFEYEPPDDRGVEVSEEDLEECGALEEYNEDSTSGFEVHLDKLPKDVTVIRFYNSW